MTRSSYMKGFSCKCVILVLCGVSAIYLSLPAANAAPIQAATKIYVALNGLTDATKIINDSLALAVEKSANPANRPVQVIFEAGTYHLACTGFSNKSCLNLSGTSKSQTTGIQLVGSGTRLLIENPDAGGIKVTNASNILISNLSIDYSIPPYTQGTIIALNTVTSKPSFDFKVDDGYPKIPDHLCAAYGNQELLNKDVSTEKLGHYPSESWGMLMESHIGNLIKHSPIPGASIQPDSCKYIGNNVWRLGIPRNIEHFIDVNDHYVQLIGRHFKKSAIWFDSSENPEIDNVQVHAAGGLATLFTGNTGTIHINALQVKFSENSTRYITTDADGIHLQHNWAKPIIENSYIEGTADDGINNYTPGLSVLSVGKDNRVLVISGEREIHIGDWVEVLSLAKGAIRGGAKVVSVELVQSVNGNPPRYTLTINKPISQVSPGDFVFDTSAAGPGAEIRNNVIGRHRGRGIVSHSENSIISGNLFKDIHWAAIKLSVNTIQKEGPTAHNVIIENNELRGGDLPWNAQVLVNGVAENGAIPVSGPSNITIRGNRFKNAKKYNIDIESAYRVNIINNEVYSDGACANSFMRSNNSHEVSENGTIYRCKDLH